MLGQKLDIDLFKLIGKRVILHDGEPLEVEVVDIVNNQVLYESMTGGTGAIDAKRFKEIYKEA